MIPYAVVIELFCRGWISEGFQGFDARQSNFWI